MVLSNLYGLRLYLQELEAAFINLLNLLDEGWEWSFSNLYVEGYIDRTCMQP